MKYLITQAALVMVAAALYLIGSISTREAEALRSGKVEFLPVAEAAQRIERYASMALPSCFADLSQSPDTAAHLTKALVAVEYVAQSRIESLMESLFVRSTAGLGIEPGDYSLGPSQIRPSTVCRRLPHHQLCGTSARQGRLQTALLDHCKNIGITLAVISRLLEAQELNGAALDPGSVETLAGLYNGQQASRQEFQVYRALVREIYRKSRAGLKSSSVSLTEASDTK